jgi:hypothetical protein
MHSIYQGDPLNAEGLPAPAPTSIVEYVDK